MRCGFVGASALLLAFSSGAWAGSDQDRLGFAPYAFALSWTSLPTGQFAPLSPTNAPVRGLDARATEVDDGQMQQVLDGAFASASEDRERRDVALNEMMTPWPQTQRWAFQRVRDAQGAYAAGDEQASERFVALASRVADGSGRSAAIDGSALVALDAAYTAALSRQDDGARARMEAAQKAFVGYRAAFAAFADARSPGTGAGVAAELDRQRAADLGTEIR